MTIEQRIKFRESLESLNIKFKESNIDTEESTKMSLILPFFRILGYDVFNPKEFCSEVTADIGIGIKNGEKVDYAVMHRGVPYILIECKHHKERNLDRHVGQLFRYYSVTKAKLGILTNGIEYRFYSDIEQINIMDKEPFYRFKIDNITELDISILELFMKGIYSNNRIKEVIEIQNRSKKNSIVYEKRFDDFFANQEQYVDVDYANLLFNMIFNSDIPKEDIDNVVTIIKRAIIRNRRIVQAENTIKSGTTLVVTRENPIVSRTEDTVEVRLIDVVLGKKELSFLKLIELKNVRTGVIWSITSWAVFLETLLNDLIDNGMGYEEIESFDRVSGENQGWIRRKFTGATNSTQKFIKLNNGLWLNTYGNASAMVQKLYKACSEYSEQLSSYHIVLTKLRR